MTSIRLSICAAILALLSTAAATAKPAYVTSTVNLRSAAGTNNEIVAKIPGGSLVDASNCTDGWCEVEWQGKKGFAIATALDQSGRVPARRSPPRAYGDASEYVPVSPPVYYGPPAYYYPYRPYYRPYYWGYGWGYRRWRRW
jgi:uncharacterized protein YraI